MKFANPAHTEILTALAESQVDFILVGGYAVIYHGYVRATGDMNVWLRPDNENKLRLLGMFRKLQFDPDSVKTLEDMNFQETVVFHVGEEFECIDFSSKVQEVNFDEAYHRRRFLDMNNQQIPFLHLSDLISSKLSRSSLQDLADIDCLLKVKKFEDLKSGTE